MFTLSSMKYPLLLTFAVFLILTGILIKFVVYPYFGYDSTQQALEAGRSVIVNSDSTLTADVETSEPVEYEVEQFVGGLFVPWDIEFTSQERMLVTERNGRVRQVVNGELVEQPLHTFTDVSQTGEEGLMGMALDPNFEENKYVYLCYAYPKGNDLVDRVVRMIDQGDQLVNEQVLLDDIPAGRFHAGCRVDFGPDEKLYVTTGDATDKQIAQELDSLGGKTLRMNSDGSIPQDNPFANSYVYSYGHRNAQGIAWHPLTGQQFQTEHGPSLIDGPAGGDEVNMIESGANYGWPLVSHEESREGSISPMITFTPAEAPGSALFYAGDVFPQFKNRLLFGALRGEGIVALEFTESTPHQLLQYEKLDGIDVGRIREVQQGPDGLIYFSTSNRDGRGNAGPSDDAIYRLVPAQ